MTSIGRKRIGIVLALVVASIVLFGVWIRGALESPRAEPALAADAAAAIGDKKSPASLATPTAVDSAAQDERHAVVQWNVPPPPPAPLASTRTPDATLAVRCIAKPGGRPLEHIRVRVWEKYQDRPLRPEDAAGTRGTLLEAPITDAKGEVELALPSGIELHLYATHDKGESGYDDRELTALAKGERRELVLEIASGEDLRFHGRVFARETRAPIDGAKVSALRGTGIDAHGEETIEELARTTTERDGRFEIGVSTWKQSYLRIDADGFAPVLVEPGTNHSTADTARVLLLERSATVEATVVDPRGSPVADVTVMFVVNGYELQPKDGAWEFDTASVAKVIWSADTGGDGRCTIKGLPPNVGLNVVLEREKKPAQKEVESVRLAPGETRAVQWTIGAGCTLIGVVVDEKEKPLARQELWLVHASQDEPRYFNIYEAFARETKLATDENGRFKFENVAAGKWWLGPGPDPNSVAGSPGAVAPFAQLVDVPAGKREMEIVVRAQRGLYIRGRVLDSAGHAAPNTSVGAGTGGKLWGMSTMTKADGTFAIGPLMPGKFGLLAQGHGSDYESEPVQADAGDENVILKLRLGGVIDGTVVDASGARCRATISLSAQLNARFEYQMMATEDDGSFTWEGLAPGVYDVVARLNDGRIAVSHSVSLAAGAHVTGLVIALEPGARVRVRYTGEKPPPWIRIKSDAAMLLSDTLLKTEATVCVVPKGKVTVALQFDGEDRVRSKEVALDVGEEKEIVFTDDG